MKENLDIHSGDHALQRCYVGLRHRRVGEKDDVGIDLAYRIIVLWQLKGFASDSPANELTDHLPSH